MRWVRASSIRTANCWTVSYLFRRLTSVSMVMTIWLRMVVLLLIWVLLDGLCSALAGGLGLGLLLVLRELEGDFEALVADLVGALALGVEPLATDGDDVSVR